MELRSVLRHITPLFAVAIAGAAAALSLAACSGNVVVDSGDGTTGTGTGTGTGTSSGTSPGNGFSCDFTVADVHECSEYSNLPAADVDAEQSACEAESGTTGTGCSSTNSLGSCTFSAGGINYAEFYYADGGETASDAQMGCDAAGGNWSPP
jgi:hypothetical protein